jgi:hypothetical protein
MPINNAKISAYTYCRNVVEMNYPIQECINSLLPVCDEIIILDASDKDDGTSQLLKSILSNNSNKIKLYSASVPWTDKNHGVYDGQTKAAARELCTGDILLQIDIDEILEDNYDKKLENILKETNNLENIELLALPVVDYWGGHQKIRIDVNPWKWRISRNLPHITHGIPSSLRQEKDGMLFAKPGTDGCNYIHSETGEPIPFVTFAPSTVDQVRRQAFQNESARQEYQKWFENATDALPTVYHLSWWSIEKKINNYRQFWNDFWPSLYGEEKPQGKNWNPFFGFKAIEDHTQEEIKAYAKLLREQTGGHVFHTQWIGQKTPHIFINKAVPTYAQKWCEENADE